MLNFSIQFTYPLLLLLIIPIVGIALILHFRVNKRFRRNRNRIISLVLHCITGVLCVAVLSGMHFDYQIPNDSNEVIFLVDVSNSEDEDSSAERDAFLSDALAVGRYDGFRIGVVSFGFDQIYSVPLTYEVDEIYNKYLNADLPDVTGTDIAAALTFSAEKFENPATAKIVLITDAKETDEEARDVIKGIAARGIRVDTVHIGSSFPESDAQVISVEYPDYHFDVGEEITIKYTVNSAVPCSAVLRVYDNDAEEAASQQIELVEGTRTFELQYTFADTGLHELLFDIESVNDELEENDVFCSYYYLDTFNDVLLVEDTTITGNTEQSTDLIELLKSEGYTVNRLDFGDDGAEIPQNISELCAYDEVILNNINQYDMPDGFMDLLYSYVYDYGGGLLTVGGDDKDGEAHAYNRTDMFSTTLQTMLPVEVINYTPPIAVMLLVDTSGSMSGELNDGTMLDAARSGAYACLDALDYRDYVGLMTLDDNYTLVLPMTSRTRDAEIRRAIAGLTDYGGGTVYTNSIRRAIDALSAVENVARRHIIIISDGIVQEDQEDEYLSYIRNAHENIGLSLSFVGINVEDGGKVDQQMQRMCDAAGGEEYGSRTYCVYSGADLTNEIQSDLSSDEITAINDEKFRPVANDKTSNLLKDITFVKEEQTDDEGGTTEVETNVVDMYVGGFYGGRVRDESYLVLSGEYDVPIYAQWNFGAGRVGSYMSDLGAGEWSSEVFGSANGRTFILNMLKSIMPISDIGIPDFDVSISTGNYINNLSVFADLEEGQTVKGTITSTDGRSVSLNGLPEGQTALEGIYVTEFLGESNKYSRCTFVIKEQGVYLLELDVCNEDGTVVSSYEKYISFSYSLEYDPAYEADVEPDELMEILAVDGNGQVIFLDDPSAIFIDFVTAIDMTYDPRLVLLITAIILFLLDVAVRKFKFKWPHEIIRERKMAKSQTRSEEDDVRK